MIFHTQKRISWAQYLHTVSHVLWKLKIERKWSLCIYVFISIYKYICVCTWAHVYVCVEVSQVLLSTLFMYVCTCAHSIQVCVHIDIGCLPQSVSTLVFETVLLLYLELNNLTRPDGQQDPSLLMSICPSVKITGVCYHAYILCRSPRAQALTLMLQPLSHLPSTLTWSYTLIVSS